MRITYLSNRVFCAAGAHARVQVQAADAGLKGYIVPGLGDAGDRIFGTKKRQLALLTSGFHRFRGRLTMDRRG
ncbi:MAG: hypothetical protein FJY25_18725 [Betaproteobacteria bacterium]|nr:hypothetical protein [Betaproteobacteria bacterium]